MTARVATLEPSDTVRRAAVVMTEHGVTILPVVGRDGRLLGVVSEADVLAHVLPYWLVTPSEDRWAASGSTDAVGEVMRKHPVTVTPETPVAVAADLLTCTAIKSLPVVADGRLVGVLSRSDLVRNVAGAVDAGERCFDDAWLVDP